MNNEASIYKHKSKVLEMENKHLLTQLSRAEASTNSSKASVKRNA